MRPILAIVISAGILLGVHSYLRFAQSLRGKPAVAEADVAASGTYSADITLTFDAQADEFALEPVSLVFKRQQETLLKREELVPAGTPLVIENLPGIVEGENEFYFECVPKEDGRQIARAVRIRLFHDGVPVAEQTLWAEPGMVPHGAVVLKVERSPHAPRADTSGPPAP
jgi:hypothetical protein